MKFISIIIVAAAIITMLAFVEADSAYYTVPDDGIYYIEWMDNSVTWPNSRHWNVDGSQTGPNVQILNWLSPDLKDNEVFRVLSESNGGFSIQTMNSDERTCVINDNGWVKTGNCDHMVWNIVCKDNDRYGRFSSCFIQDDNSKSYASMDNGLIRNDNNTNWQLVPIRPAQSVYTIQMSDDYNWRWNIPKAKYQEGTKIIGYYHSDADLSDNEKFQLTHDSSGAYLIQPQYHLDLCVTVIDNYLKLAKCNIGAAGYQGLWWIDCTTRFPAHYYGCYISQYGSDTESDQYAVLPSTSGDTSIFLSSDQQDWVLGRL